MISKAEPTDHIELSQLCKKSKAYWGYSDEQLKSWDEDLTISEKYIYENQVYKFIDNNTIIGLYTFYLENETTIRLDHLFVHPNYIGKGIGVKLMNHLIESCKSIHKLKIIVDADPNASAFYSKLGFITIGQKPTSIKNRFLPIMELQLQK